MFQPAPTIKCLKGVSLSSTYHLSSSITADRSLTHHEVVDPGSAIIVGHIHLQCEVYQHPGEMFLAKTEGNWWLWIMTVHNRQISPLK